MVKFGQSEEGVRAVFNTPLAIVGSDGSSYACDGPLRRGVPHPRSFGTFVRHLGHYARDESVLSLETAVRQMTSAPAARLGLAGRGILREGFLAEHWKGGIVKLSGRIMPSWGKSHPIGVICRGLKIACIVFSTFHRRCRERSKRTSFT